MVINKYLAELIGTFILVALGSMTILTVGGAVGGGEVIAIAFGFGLALLAGIWAVGHVSGAHFNPAVTLAMLLDGRISLSDAIGYWVAQIAGGILGGLAILGVGGSQDEVAKTLTGYSDLQAAIISEVVLTAVFIWVIMAAVKRGTSFTPAAIALTLVGVHLAGIGFSGASVNPARSFGPALIAGDMSQVLVYFYAPLIGAVLAWGLYRLYRVED